MGERPKAPSIKDRPHKPRHGMKEHVDLLREQGLPIPPKTTDPKITIENAKAVA